MSEAALVTYRSRLRRVARRYKETIGPDDGFGLTASQGSSLVNTAEALIVLRAAMKRQLPVDPGAVRRALAYLADNLPVHCAPRSAGGGRGEKARFVSFSLAGLAAWPEEIGPTAVETIRWGVEWFDRHANAEGIPEEAGTTDASLFQNAVAVSALCRVIDLDVCDNRCRNLARRVIQRSIAGSLYSALPNATWPRQTFGSRTSPAKTAMLLVALHDARHAGLVSDRVRFAGTKPGGGQELSFDEFVQEGIRWLVDNTDRWRGFIEADPDVSGTQWHHLAYALCLEATTTVAISMTPALAECWHDLLSSWDQSRNGWSEPTTPPLVTVRADYVAVRAIEALLEAQGTQAIEALREARDRRPTGEAPAWPTLYITRHRQFALETDAERVALRFSPSHESVLHAMVEMEGHRRSVPTIELAARVGKAENGIGTYVRRINQTVATQAAGPPLVIGRKGHGYRLNVRAVVRVDFPSIGRTAPRL